MVNIRVQFHSYFKELAGTDQTTESMPAGSTLGQLYRQLTTRFPRLEAMQKSTLIAVGVDYQGRHYVLQEGDEVSLFPPVQGG